MAAPPPVRILALAVVVAVVAPGCGAPRPDPFDPLRVRLQAAPDAELANDYVYRMRFPANFPVLDRVDPRMRPGGRIEAAWMLMLHGEEEEARTLLREEADVRPAYLPMIRGLLPEFELDRRPTEAEIRDEGRLLYVAEPEVADGTATPLLADAAEAALATLLDRHGFWVLPPTVAEELERRGQPVRASAEWVVELRIRDAEFRFTSEYEASATLDVEARLVRRSDGEVAWSRVATGAAALGDGFGTLAIAEALLLPLNLCLAYLGGWTSPIHFAYSEVEAAREAPGHLGLLYPALADALDGLPEYREVSPR